MTDSAAIAARVRAAQAWAGMSDDELGQALGVSRRTVGRMKSHGDNVDRERRALVAVATGVPEEFMENGWQAEEPALGERVEALERQMRALWATSRGAAEPLTEEEIRLSDRPLEFEPPERGRPRRAG